MEQTTLTNKELANSLRALADVLDANSTIVQPNIWVYTSTKSEFTAFVNAVGGAITTESARFGGDCLKVYLDKLPGVELTASTCEFKHLVAHELMASVG